MTQQWHDWQDHWVVSYLSGEATRELLEGPVRQVAPRLLGALLSHTTDEGTVTLRLTEVEAYDGANDPGSHAFRGQTPRTAVMFGPAMHVYCYFTYGMHTCCNIVTGHVGAASAVLLRAGEVVDGTDLARTRRSGARDRDLARGPARLTKALGIKLDSNGSSLDAAPFLLQVLVDGADAASIRTGPRVGVSGPGGDAVGYPWRYWLAEEPTVSAYRQGRVRGIKGPD